MADTTKVRELFAQHDTDGSGCLSYEEMCNLLTIIDEELSYETAEQMVKEADADEDGEVNIEEFIGWCFGEGRDIVADFLEEAPEEANGPGRDCSWRISSDHLLNMSGDLEGRGDDEKFPDDTCGKCDDAIFIPAQLAPVAAKLVKDPNQARLFQSVSPHCCCQGSIGDCWFIAAIASLAEYPQLVYQCFPGQEGIASDGNYRVRLYDPKTWEEHIIEITDVVPFRPGGGSMPLFVRPTGNEIFPMLLEKAAAKFAHMGLGDFTKNNSWFRLKGGWMIVGWAMLTGAKESNIITRKTNGKKWSLKEISTMSGSSLYTSSNEKISGDDLYSKMAEWDTSGVMMGCSMAGGCEVDKGEGIVTGHAYSITAVKECSAGRVIQCRNPWGNAKEWSGKMSDSSGYWNSGEGKKVADELQYSPVNDGLFWMTWDDWVTRFTKVYVTHTSAPKRDFTVEFTEVFFKMVDRKREGAFDGATPEEKQKLKYLWDSYSAPLGGYIDEQQLLVLLKKMDMPPADEEDDLIATHQEFDSDGDGKVGWDDFFNEMETRVRDGIYD